MIEMVDLRFSIFYECVSECMFVLNISVCVCVCSRDGCDSKAINLLAWGHISPSQAIIFRMACMFLFSILNMFDFIRRSMFHSGILCSSVYPSITLVRSHKFAEASFSCDWIYIFFGHSKHCADQIICISFSFLFGFEMNSFKIYCIYKTF